MSFFAARKPSKGALKTNGTVASTTAASSSGLSTASKPSNGVTTGSSATSTVNKTTPATSTTTKLVSVTRKVSAAAVPQTVRERQALAKAKRAKEIRREAQQEEERHRRLQSEQKSEKEQAAKRRKLEKGKARASSNGDSYDKAPKRNKADSASSSGAETPLRRSKLTVESSDDEDSSRLGTPVFERKQPLRVMRSDVAAPKDGQDRIDVLSGEQHVRRSMTDYVACEWR